VPYNSADASGWLSEKTRIPALVLPFTVGGSGGPNKETATDLFALYEQTVKYLIDATDAQR
jgi:zinc/manganese transport system substrate-binding protein